MDSPPSPSPGEQNAVSSTVIDHSVANSQPMPVNSSLTLDASTSSTAATTGPDIEKPSSFTDDSSAANSQPMPVNTSVAMNASTSSTAATTGPDIEKPSSLTDDSSAANSQHMAVNSSIVMDASTSSTAATTGPYLDKTSSSTENPQSHLVAVSNSDEGHSGLFRLPLTDVGLLLHTPSRVLGSSKSSSTTSPYLEEPYSHSEYFDDSSSISDDDGAIKLREVSTSGGRFYLVVKVSKPMEQGFLRIPDTENFLNVPYIHYCIETKTNLPSYKAYKMPLITYRSFDDFKWLHEMLSCSSPGVSVPKLPEKSWLGSSSNRLDGLNRFLELVAKDDVLQKSPFLDIFLQAKLILGASSTPQDLGHHLFQMESHLKMALTNMEAFRTNLTNIELATAQWCNHSKHVSKEETTKDFLLEADFFLSMSKVFNGEVDSMQKVILKLHSYISKIRPDLEEIVDVPKKKLNTYEMMALRDRAWIDMYTLDENGKVVYNSIERQTQKLELLRKQERKAREIKKKKLASFKKANSNALIDCVKILLENRKAATLGIEAWLADFEQRIKLDSGI